MAEGDCNCSGIGCFAWIALLILLTAVANIEKGVKVIVQDCVTTDSLTVETTP